MGPEIDLLKVEIDIQRNKIKKSYPSDGRCAIIELTRCIDHSFVYISYVLPKGHTGYQNASEIFSFIAAGFYDAIKSFINDGSINEEGYPFFPSADENIKWANSCLINLGHIGFTVRFMELARQGLFKISYTDSIFNFQNCSPNPGREGMGNDDFHWWQRNREITQVEEKRLIELSPIVQKQIYDLPQVWRDFFIKYGCTPELDRYYEIIGKDNARILVGYDSFPESAIFNGVKFGDIKKVLEAIIGYALKHKDHCLSLLKKTNYKINPWNLYTLPELTTDLIEAISIHKELDNSVVKKALQLLILTQENISKMGDAPGNAPPPYIKIGKTHILRSMAGCLSNPFSYLLTSLKYNCAQDYFNAVNEREFFFKNDLYNLLESQNILACKNNIQLKTNGKIITDIDALLYDKQNNFLLIIQLKWLDDFGTSMRMRASMSNNFYNSSKKWIDNVLEWVKLNAPMNLVERCGVKKDNLKFDATNIQLLILGRNFSHFSDMQEDENAIWCSWYKLLRTIDANPSLKNNLKALSLQLKENSLGKQKLPPLIESKLKVGKYNIKIII